jgi:hypothetical protein
MGMGRLPFALLAAAVLLLAGCGGSDSSSDPASNVPSSGGLREKVRAAQTVTAADFPPAGGRTLQEVANASGSAGPELGMATSVFTPGLNRVAFGMIDNKAGFVYGKTAVYIAPSPDAKASGPYPAPADVLLTQGRYRSKQSATEADPFAAVYAAQVPFGKPGKYSILAVTKTGTKSVAAPGQVNVVSKADDRIPEVGQKMPPHFVTDTLASAKGDIKSIDTRQPPDDMHGKSFDQVVGKKPVALVIATPQLCQSRVCGPVVDVAEQMKSRYGKQVEFIHQEVYKNNDPKQGLRTPLERLNLATEPWLFVVNKDGKITARLEGSFGVGAFEKALKTAL